MYFLFLLCKPLLVLPEYTEWAPGHPVDRDCVTMLLGDGVVHQGEWLDVECVEDTGMFSVCERDKMSVASLFIFLIIMLRRHTYYLLNMYQFELQIVDNCQNIRSPPKTPSRHANLTLCRSCKVQECINEVSEGSTGPTGSN